MDRGLELREFLRSRRARLTPEDVGLPPARHRRRVPGLRREELAQLAGVSPDYYARLEQGRLTNVSIDVLYAVGRALRLDETEYAHLLDLARPHSAPRASQQWASRVSPSAQVPASVQAMLDSLHGVPAFVLGPRMDVLAWNHLAAALIADFAAIPREHRNLCRIVFLDESSPALYPDWEEVARRDVAILRRYAGRHPDDKQLAALVGELSLKSEQFRIWWGQHDVREKTSGTKRYHHPLVGDVTVVYNTLAIAGWDGQHIITYTTEPGSPSQAALAMLASWTVTSAVDHRTELPAGEVSRTSGLPNPGS